MTTTDDAPAAHAAIQPATPAAPAAPAARGRRRGRLVAGVVVLLAVAGAGVLLAHPWRSPAAKGAAPPAAGSLATVTRRDLSAQTQVDGTLGYAGSYPVINQARGTITWLPGLGTVIRSGHVLYRVDGTPVLLLRGKVPAYRDLAEGATADAVTGADVRQLNAALVRLGYAKRSDLDPHSDEFGWATRVAVERLQSHFGMAKTGRLPLGSVVFLPRSLRVQSRSAVRGAPAGPGATVLTGTSTRRTVSIALDVAQQSQVKVGNPVTITLPDQSTTTGRVTSVGRVATSAADQGQDKSATIAVTVTLRHPGAAGHLDAAPVLVGLETGRAAGALVVPVTALLALAGGGYAVEVVSAEGQHRLVAVTPGLFDDADGLVAVTGDGIAAGQRVVVPSS